MARNGDGSLRVRAAPNVVTGTVTDPLTSVFTEVCFELPPCGERPEYGEARRRSTLCMELHVAFEPDEGGWVRATIEELPSVITCAPALEKAPELMRDALAE